MGGEDFSYFTQAVPAAMMRLGVMNRKIGADKPWHSSEFKIDEKAIPIGAALLAMAVSRMLMQA
jgi:amidohydrolase